MERAEDMLVKINNGGDEHHSQPTHDKDLSWNLG